MAIKTTVQDVKDVWGIDANPGDDPMDIMFKVLALMDARLERIEKQLAIENPARGGVDKQ